SAAAVSPAASNRSATPVPEDETLRGPQPKRCAPLPARHKLLMEDISHSPHRYPTVLGLQPMPRQRPNSRAGGDFVWVWLICHIRGGGRCTRLRAAEAPSSCETRTRKSGLPDLRA